MDIFKPMNFTKSDAMVQADFDLPNSDVRIEKLKAVLKKFNVSNNKDFVKMIIINDSYKDLVHQILGIQT